MKTVLAPRASAILYNLLVTHTPARPFLLPANICPIVPITFMKAHTDFEFVDIDPISLHMDLDSAYARLKTDRFGGILYAHTYGEPSTPDGFFAAVKGVDDSVLIIDDRCLCEPDLGGAASAADVTLYSTGYGKIVDLGAGGYALSKSEINYQDHPLPFDEQALATLEQSYKDSSNHSSRFTYHDSNWLQTNTDLTWETYHPQVESALIKAQAHRTALNEIYSKRLPLEIQLPAGYQSWRFNIRVNAQQHIIASIFAAGLFASAHYASLAGIMSDGNCPYAEHLVRSVINLFNDQHFNLTMAEQVCDVILKNL